MNPGEIIAYSVICILHGQVEGWFLPVRALTVTVMQNTDD